MQGDSCLILTSLNTSILIDGGGSETYDVGENILLPYLLSRRITKIDYILCSHFDTDHCGGIKTILENIKVKNLIISKQKENYENFNEIMQIAKKKHVNIIIVKAKDRIAFDKTAYIDVLYPTKNLAHSDINNNSIVAKFISKGISILFTGDIEKEAEENILNIYTKKELKADILKVAHHGSKTSSSYEFLNAVSPKIALIGVGENNTFNHPSDITIKNLKELNAKIYRTDKNGEIEITVKNKNDIKIKTNINN